MEHIVHNHPLESSPDSKPEELLEECWFFGNSIDRKTSKAMLRCYSDPCPSSSNHNQEEMLAGNSSMKKIYPGGGFDLPVPPLPPPCMAAREDQEKEENSRNKFFPEPPRHNLRRTPSLPPPCVGREEDVESEFSLSKLIRQASLESPPALPPKRNSKVMKQSSSIPRRKNPEPETIDGGDQTCNEMRRLCLHDQTKIMRKSLTGIELKQVRRSNHLGFKFEQRDSNPSEEDNSSAPPVPSWVDSKDSSAEDMKTQIKFWARSVAANVR